AEYPRGEGRDVRSPRSSGAWRSLRPRRSPADHVPCATVPGFGPPPSPLRARSSARTSPGGPAHENTRAAQSLSITRTRAQPWGGGGCQRNGLGTGPGRGGGDQLVGGGARLAGERLERPPRHQPVTQHRKGSGAVTFDDGVEIVLVEREPIACQPRAGLGGLGFDRGGSDAGIPAD